MNTNSAEAARDLHSLYGHLASFVSKGGGVVRVNTTNLYVVAFSGPADTYALNEIEGLIAAGARVTATLRIDSLAIAVEAAPREGWVLEARGELIEGFSDRDVEIARNALADGDLQLIIETAQSASWEGEVSLANDPRLSGVSWIESLDTLIIQLGPANWMSTITRTFVGSHAAFILVSDAGQSFLEGSRLLVTGPAGPIDEYDPSPVSDSVTEYLSLRPSIKAAAVPAPDGLVPLRGDGMDAMRDLFQTVAHNLCWYWIASRVREDGNVLSVQFDGARLADVELNTDSTGLESSLGLWMWVTGNAEPDRLQAVEHAASLALFSSGDFRTAAGPVLRTAKSIYHAARSGAIGEAIATRRAVRQAALEAANSASNEARTTAAKTLERIVIQAGAVAAILLGNANQLLADTAVIRMLEFVGAVFLGTAIMAVMHHANAQDVLTAFDKDLDNYRDTLGEDDLDTIRKSHTLAVAKKQTQQSATVTTIYLVIAGLALVMLLYSFTNGELKQIF